MTDGSTMDKFLIAPIKGGIKTNLVPFMIPEDTFQQLRNMFIYEGKIRRRPGARFLDITDARGLTSRLRINIGTTDGAGNLGATVVPGTGAIGQQFSVGATIFTVYQANGAMYVSPAGATGTFNTGTNTVTITGAAATTIVYWYPSLPVLGIGLYEKTNGTVQEFAYDTQFFYKYDPPNAWQRVTGPVPTPAIPDSARYQSMTWQGRNAVESHLFVTDHRTAIKYYNDTTTIFTNFYPATSAVANYNVRRCRFIIDFQGRMLLLNTYEYEGAAVEQPHVNRIRYSEYGEVFNADSWYQPTAVTNKGGFVDLPAGEQIFCAEILDGRLIIFAEYSIYELVPTGNYREPFQLALVDETHGSESRNTVEVNNTLLFANNFGIYIYDGRNVNKISLTLDDDYDSYEYRYGRILKDSGLEVIYILMARSLDAPDRYYPNRILMYNYRNNTFSIIKDLYTTSGTLYTAPNGSTYVQPLPLYGNHKGYTLLFNPSSYKNYSSQSIIAVSRFDANNIDLRIYNHQLEVDSIVRIENSLLADLNGSYEIQQVVDANTIRILNDASVVGNYLGDGTIALVDSIRIITKQFNPYMKQGFGTSINKIAFNVNRTATNGIYDIIGRPNNSNIENFIFNYYLGDRQLETAAYALVPEEAEQDRVWHHVYTQTTGESVSLVISFGANEILDANIPYQELTINAIMLYTEPAKYI